MTAIDPLEMTCSVCSEKASNIFDNKLLCAKHYREVKR